MVALHQIQVPLQCINEAAYEYHISAKLIIAVLNVEGGKVGQAHKNQNGTYDLGPMQINSAWWPKFYAYGITPQQVLYDSCINVKVGAWILSKSIADNRNFLFGVGGYNSLTPSINAKYVQNIRIKYTLLNKYLT